MGCIMHFVDKLLRNLIPIMINISGLIGVKLYHVVFFRGICRMLI
jgi:sorbitol-specific phosphotransferase system component IIBC